MQWEAVWSISGWALDLWIRSGGYVAATHTQKARITSQQPCGHTVYSLLLTMLPSFRPRPCSVCRSLFVFVLFFVSEEEIGQEILQESYQ